MAPSVSEQDPSSPFDASAETYDAQFTRASIGQWQRRVVWHALEQSLDGGELVLEVGCGTGEDAVFLASLGCSVIATDGSERMVASATEKVKNADLQDRVSVCRINLPRLEVLGPNDSIGPVGTESVDRVFSDFGGLNCLNPEDLKQFFRESRLRLQPGGRILLVLMPESCWWESLYFLLRGRWHKAFRRRHSPQRATLQSPAEGTTEELDVWYYSASALAELAPEFSIRRVAPVGFLVPPSFLQPWFRHAPGLWLGTVLAWGDRKLARAALATRHPFARRLAYWLARHSDHYWVELGVCAAEVGDREQTTEPLP